MFANLTESIKRRFIMELRNYWSTEPQYKDNLVIQGKFSFEERPQQAIILKSNSASATSLAADHFMGTVSSYCTLTGYYGKQGTSIEWIKEDSVAIQQNNSKFPTPPGIYYIEVVEEQVLVKGEPRDKLVFYVDPLLEIVNEIPLRINNYTFEVGAGGFHAGSLRVFEVPGNFPYYEGVNYTADPETGTITLLKALPNNLSLSVDYRYAGQSTGPYVLEENGTNNTAIPGVILAFGRRAFAGDVMCVLVTRQREDVFLQYGGNWELSLDFDIMARDLYSQGEIADRTVMYLYTTLRDRLGKEGIVITDVSLGGEGEETYDDNGDDYFYTASVSVTVMTDWFMFKPMPRYLSRVVPHQLVSEVATNALTDDELIETGNPTTLTLVESLKLVELRDPFYSNRTKDFEIIK
jgi:hypothetical protein